MSEIKITCKGADLLPLDAITEFQGGLKKRTKKDIEKIITSIKKYGFSFPFFIWNGTGDNYCLDGHGRIQALAEMRRQGVDLPLFPVVYVEAGNAEEAKQKLLRLNSQYGELTMGGLMDFAEDIELATEELSFGFEITFDKKEAEEVEIKPYEKVHVLLSFHPSLFVKIKKNLEQIQKTPGIEYESSAN